MMDRISQLPDEVLALILSGLSLREAAATSVMSRRWKNLWTFITSLDFDVLETLNDIELELTLCETEKPRYIRWVNQVLDLRQSSIISMFRICFPLNQTSKSDIDRWLEIVVMGKKVQRFELDLKQDLDSSFKPTNFYAFPYEVLVSPRHFGSFECLTYLCFKCVNVSGQVLEYFLSNCPLERLCVEYSSVDLVNLNVTHPCLQLKYLKIICCRKLERIGIFAPSLVSFKYCGPQINLQLNNFPSLVEASFGTASYGISGIFSGNISYAFGQLSSYLSQLESLKLEVDPIEAINGLPQLTNLKRLVLTVCARDYHNLLQLTSLIRASPYLYKFVLKLEWCESGRRQREVRRVSRCPYMHLKVLELIGFVGRALDVEFAEHILENAIMLEKITINTCHPSAIGTPFEFDESEARQTARDRAMDLRAKLPQGAELFVI
uniref:F-box domain-containing protein n=1 Tax=Davidia involucrata TaxID=16924 RepID=A0A5B7A1Y3_DAVIN